MNYFSQTRNPAVNADVFFIKIKNPIDHKEGTTHEDQFKPSFCRAF